MPKPSVREDRALHTWIAFPSEQLRRAYVQASASIVGEVKGDTARTLRLLVSALGGREQADEPKD